jgi:hypothetical protein
MIYISTVSRRGSSHVDWNEDNFCYHQTGNAIVGGVFDGCSSGKDSYFASKLFANMFIKTIEKCKEEELISNNFENLVYVYFKNLFKAIESIGLGIEETLSTSVLFIYELNSNNLFVKFFGDGVAYANNQSLEVFNNDENNQPDYIGYSLSEVLKKNNFSKYWNMKKSFTLKTNDFSISTDGIFSFQNSGEQEPLFSCESFLVQDDFLYKNPAFLKRKLNILKNKGYDHYDDLTIIRVKID